MSGKVHPHGAYRFPVSIKGVCIRDGEVLLLENERGEWELPGGKLELGEDPAACLAREIHEETRWSVEVAAILDAWQYHIFEGVDVLVVTYGCVVLSSGAPQVSEEHKRVGLFDLDAVAALTMPAQYKASITTWREYLKRLRPASFTKAGSPRSSVQPSTVAPLRGTDRPWPVCVLAQAWE